MATYLPDLIPEDVYLDAGINKYVRTQKHPTLPYLIHNYTEAATWDNVWNEATLNCRGLITIEGTGEIIARPFPKFFNHDQEQAAQFDLDEEVIVLDKADGSLGILYPLPDGQGYAIATRGSFTSDQAAWATAHWNKNHASVFTPKEGLTYLFEIVYRENRIVLDYGDFEGLILLGAIDNATGAAVPLSEAMDGWEGRTVEVFPHSTLREVLNAPEHDNAEGFVVWSPERNERVKIKFAEYKRLHKLLTGVNERHVWEVLSRGEDPAEAFSGAPDEFHGWLRSVIQQLEAQFAAIVEDAKKAHAEVLAELPEGWERRDYALLAGQRKERALLFLLLDERPLDASVWKLIYPEANQTFKVVSSDAD